MSQRIDFLAVLVFDRDDGWVSLQPHTFTASHPEIAYQMALGRGKTPRGSQRFVGLSELKVLRDGSLKHAEMVKGDPAALVKEKANLSAFQDPRWQGIPFDSQELESALRAPAIASEPKDLEAVDWGRLSHAYGSAQDVPIYLRNLGSEEAEIRHQALRALVMTILHQGSLYSATVAAIPFLLRLVAAPSHPARLETMDLVLMIVKECCFDAYRQRREVLLAAGNDTHEGLGGEPDLVAAISEVLWADMDLLERLQSDEDPHIRDMVDVVFAELKGESSTS